MRSIILPLTLSLTLGLVACQTAPLPQTIQQQPQISAIQGQVHWPTRPGLQVQATLEDIQTQATVSLIYPSDHPTQPNRTIATGLTNASGQFIINPDSNFTPAQGTVLVLEASKRVQGPGADLLTLRTFLRWEGSNGWNSITGSSVSLNTLTTAIAILASVENSFSSADTIGTVSQGVLNTALGNISSETVGTVQNLVEQSLWENQDPGHVIYWNGNAYARLITTVPAPTPLPTATSDIFVIERTTFNGQVFDDTRAPLDGVTIVARSLNSSVPFEETTTTAGGAYAFNNAPAGVQIEITATREGYTTRRRVEVLKSNQQGDPNANKYDFGTDGNDGTNGTVNNALSDKPEVVSVTPGRNASGIAPNTSFVITFSEAMDRKTVEDNFVIASFTQETLSVDSQVTFKSADFTIGTTGAEAPIAGVNGTKVWDKNAFAISWNNDSTEVTFTFRDERMLPTDKESANTPDYYFTFTEDDRQLKDVSGVTRDNNYFKLTEGRFEGAVKFSIQTDRNRPAVNRITAQTAENSSFSGEGDVIKVVYSERMVHYTSGDGVIAGAGAIAGGRDGVAAKAVAANNLITAQAAAENYEVEVIRSGTVIRARSKWSAMPIEGGGTTAGRAIFDPHDATHKTVLLIPGDRLHDIYRPDDTVNVTVSTSVMDPAGNTLDNSSNSASTTASGTTPYDPTPYDPGNSFLGFMNTPQMTDLIGLAVVGGQAYMTHYIDGTLSNNLSVRRLALSSGSTTETTVWGQFFGKPEVQLSGVAANNNNGEFWTVSNNLPSVTDGEDDAYNLYHFRSNGERIQRYRVGTQGIVLNDVAVDSSSGVVYIVSLSTQSLIRFNPANLSETNMLFSGAQSINPVGVGLDASGNIYVSDATTRRVIKYAKADGTKTSEFGASQNLNAIGDVAVDPRNGDVYVIGNSGSGTRIFRFNSHGNFIHSFTHQNLSQPQKIAVGADGRLYVADSGLRSVMSFSSGN